MQNKNRSGGLNSLISLAFLVGLFSMSANAHVISEEDHHAFEHKYAEMCVKKEKAALKGSVIDLPALNTLCECIAKEESKSLTLGEVKKFLRENKYPVSLMMKADAAANICGKKK